MAKVGTIYTHLLFYKKSLGKTMGCYGLCDTVSNTVLLVEPRYVDQNPAILQVNALTKSSETISMDYVNLGFPLVKSLKMVHASVLQAMDKHWGYTESLKAEVLKENKKSDRLGLECDYINMVLSKDVILKSINSLTLYKDYLESLFDLSFEIKLSEFNPSVLATSFEITSEDLVTLKDSQDFINDLSYSVTNKEGVLSIVFLFGFHKNDAASVTYANLMKITDLLTNMTKSKKGC